MLLIKLPNSKIEIDIAEIKRVITITDKFMNADCPFFVFKTPNIAITNETNEIATVKMRGCISSL